MTVESSLISKRDCLTIPITAVLSTSIDSNDRNVLLQNNRSRKMHLVLKWILLLAVILGILVAILVDILPIISINVNIPNYKGEIEHRLKRSTPMDDGGQRICSSAACFNQSMAILSVMNLSVDPCNDFYQHACGNWNYRDEIKIDQLRDENRFNIQKILEQPTESLLGEAEKKAQRYYHSCLRSRKTDEVVGPSTTLLKLLNLIGGAPVNDEISYISYFKKKEWDFQEVFQTVQHTLNIDGFFRRTVEVSQVKEDNSHPSRRFIKLSPSGLTFTRQDYFSSDSGYTLSSMFEERMKEAEDVLYSGNSFSPKWKLSPIQNKLALKDIIEVETQIAEITPVAELEEFLTVDELNNLAPSFDWNRYLHTAVSAANSSTTAYTVMVSSRDFFRDVSIFVKKLLASGRGQEKLKNYLFWRTVNQFLKKTKDFSFQIKKSAILDCSEKTAEAMPLALGAMLMQKRLRGDSSTKHLVETIGQSIKEAYKENLNNLWMGNGTRKLLRDKVDAIKTLIGYPDFILHSKEVEKFYAGLNFSSSEFFWNNIQLELFTQTKMLIDQPVDTLEWTLPLPISEPSFKSDFNLLLFPSWIMEPPFFDATFPHAINFGSVGAFFGHELTHGFGTKGLKYDRNGELRQWLNSSAIQPFVEKRSECLIQQYSNYLGNTLYGRSTLDENIADNGGLKASYIAYNNWLNNHEDIHLPLPITLTNEQLFFLSFAQSWCSSDNVKYISGLHSPDRFRVIGALSNMPEFSSAFQCPLGSRMNPIEKCEIW